MRKGVDYIGVAVVFFCHDGKGNFVMAKRSDKCRDEVGRWDIGGGGLEFGMTIDENLRKEILEEYCSEVIEYDFLGFRDVHRENNSEKTHWMALDFKVLVNPLAVSNGEPDKFEQVKWFNFENFPGENEVHSQFPKFLDLYVDKLKN